MQGFRVNEPVAHSWLFIYGPALVVIGVFVAGIIKWAIEERNITYPHIYTHETLPRQSEGCTHEWILRSQDVSSTEWVDVFVCEHCHTELRGETHGISYRGSS